MISYVLTSIHAEPDNNGTSSQSTCNVAAVTGSLSTIIVIETLALVALVTVLIVGGTRYRRMNGKQTKKENVVYVPQPPQQHVSDHTSQNESEELGHQSPSTDVSGQGRIMYNRPRVPAKAKPMYVNASSMIMPTLWQSNAQDEDGYDYVDRDKLPTPPDDM